MRRAVWIGWRSAGGLLFVCLAAGCVRTSDRNPPLTPGADARVDRASADLARDRAAGDTRDLASADLLRPDAALQTQVLKILATGDDGEITGSSLLPSGETWYGNLIHAGSWASVASGGPTTTYAYLRHRLARALPAGAKLKSATLQLFGHALTGGSKWSSALHKLIVSADQSPSAAQVASALGFPGGAKGAPQTKAAIEWGQIVWKADAWNTSPNLATIVQELVDTHGGLAAGAYLQLWLRAPKIYDEDAELPFEDLDHANGQAAVLTLEWAD